MDFAFLNLLLVSLPHLSYLIPTNFERRKDNLGDGVRNWGLARSIYPRWLNSHRSLKHCLEFKGFVLFITIPSGTSGISYKALITIVGGPLLES